MIAIYIVKVYLIYNQFKSIEYDPAFARSDIEISPLAMLLSSRVYTFSGLSRQSFYGLPDKFGTALIDAWFATRGRAPDTFNAVERLYYTGEGGMGALEFAPAMGPKARQANRIEVDRLVELASEVPTHRNYQQVSFADADRELALGVIRRLGLPIEAIEEQFRRMVFNIVQPPWQGSIQDTLRLKAF